MYGTMRASPRLLMLASRSTTARGPCTRLLSSPLRKIVVDPSLPVRWLLSYTTALTLPVATYLKTLERQECPEVISMQNRNVSPVASSHLFETKKLSDGCKRFIHRKARPPLRRESVHRVPHQILKTGAGLRGSGKNHSDPYELALAVRATGSPRSELVQKLYEMVNLMRVIEVVGTRTSGKTTLSHLLYLCICELAAMEADPTSIDVHWGSLWIPEDLAEVRHPQTYYQKWQDRLREIVPTWRSRRVVPRHT